MKAKEEPKRRLAIMDLDAPASKKLKQTLSTSDENADSSNMANSTENCKVLKTFLFYPYIFFTEKQMLPTMMMLVVFVIRT